MSLTPLFSFIGFNAEYLQCKGVCHDSQTDPLDPPRWPAPWPAVTMWLIVLSHCDSLGAVSDVMWINNPSEIFLLS